MFHVNRFTHSAKDKSFVAEISDLQQGSHQPIWERLYPDACDVGIVLATDCGTTAKFYMGKEVTNDEGELTHWELLPCEDDVRKNPRLAGYSVVIFND